MEHGSIRNLEQIQEKDPSASGSRLGTLIMASIAGACVVFAVVALVRKPATSKTMRPDPLSELVGKNAPAASARLKGPNLSDRDFAFPDLLSDDPHPTTALATIGSANPSLSSAAMVLPQGASSAPPAAADKLPVVPLPAQNYLALSPVVTAPRDSLTATANQASTPGGPEASEGTSGGYQLQVSSFRLQEEATKFAGALRKRGHRAHFESALVPGKGTWYRVRIGPFKTKLDAMHYRRDFEMREHMVPFLVEPLDKLPSAVARKAHMPRNPD
jgi:DedD protein